ISRRRRLTRSLRDWSSDVCPSDLGGRVPIGGSYGTEEPNKVRVTISGANALSAAAMLGLKVDQSQNLTINFFVDGDEMKVTDVRSEERRVGEEEGAGRTTCQSSKN